MKAWTFRLKIAGNGFMVSEDDGNICDVFMTNDPTIAKRRAFLITSAPEMYRACEVGFTALWAIKTRLSEPRTDAEKAAMDELQRRMDIIGAALRKARGEQ
jgi:hypothetical protein